MPRKAKQEARKEESEETPEQAEVSRQLKEMAASEQEGPENAKRKLEELLGGRKIKVPVDTEFNLDFCREMREGMDKDPAAMSYYLASLAYGIPKKKQEEEKAKELDKLGREVKSSKKLKELVANGDTLADCLKVFYDGKIGEWAYPHLLAGDLDGAVNKKVVARFSLAKLGLVRPFEQKEWEEAYEATREFYIKCVNHGTEYTLSEEPAEDEIEFKGASLYQVIKGCMKVGISAEELDINREAVRDFIVDKFFRNDSGQMKRFKPENIKEAIKQLNEYFGLEKPKKQQ